MAILGQVRALTSLNEITRAEAHLLLSWLKDHGPLQLAELAKLVKKPEATVVI